MNTSEQVELILQAQNLKNTDTFSKSDSYCEVFMQISGGKCSLGKTQVRQNQLNPKWNKTFLVDYIFQELQIITFIIKDKDTKSDDVIAQCQVQLGAIVNSIKGEKKIDLKPKGHLKVFVQKPQSSKKLLQMRWSGSKIKKQKYLTSVDGLFGIDLFNKSDPFLRFHKKRNEKWMMCHQTQFIKNNQQPVWKEFSILNRKLAQSDDAPILLQCWDDQKDGAHKYIGQCVFTLNQIYSDPKFQITITDKKKKSAGVLSLKHLNVKISYSFLDYLRGGLQLNSVAYFNQMVAIDFTMSNRDPQDPQSLHSLQNQPNQYQQVIQKVIRIILQYDSDKRIPLYGFGAKLNKLGQTNHCFPLNFNDNQPEVVGVQGVMQCYQSILFNKQVNFSGPTYINNIIARAIQNANYQKAYGIYTILLILTDGSIYQLGAIHDQQKVGYSLKACKDVPLSIIVVGIGYSPQLYKLEKLDQLKSPGYRDVLQFVQYSKCNHFLQVSNNVTLLASQVLKQIPAQLVQYKTLVGQPPIKI